MYQNGANSQVRIGTKGKNGLPNVSRGELHGGPTLEFPETARRQDILGHDMDVIISMLRGVNVGGHNKIKMDALRELYESLKLWDAQSYVQSGNVIFRSDERDISRLTKRIDGGIERKFGFRPDVIFALQRR